MAQKKKKNSSSRQKARLEPNTKLVLVSRKPLLYLEFSKPNKQNVCEINSFNKFNFSQSQINCWHTDWRRALQNIKINTKTLLSDANVPARFRAQQRAKYSSLQLTAYCIAAKRCLRHFIFQTDHRPQRTQISTVTDASFRSKLESNGLRVDCNRKFPERILFLPHFDVICDLLLNRRTATWNLFVK